jgi:hypothetical protein
LSGRNEQNQTMPYCGFYAAPGDFEPILQFVFDELDCRVLEAYSRFDKELREFSGLDELVRNCKLGDCSHSGLSCYLVLWPVPASDNVRIRRIELTSAASELGTHRYVAEGWGLISLQLGGLSKKGLHPSSTNHNSEKRARKWAGTLQESLGNPSTWDWNVVTRTSAKLNRRIRSLGSAKLGSRPVLPAAKDAVDSGARALGF